MKTESTLLINGAFALRQQRGLPVFTTIETEIILHSPEFLEKYEKHFKDLGFKLANRKRRIKTDHPVDLSILKRIIVTPNAKGYISTFFLEFCKVHSVPIYWIDRKGRIDSSFIPFHYLKPSLALKQYEAKLNGKALDICKYLIMLKLESMGMKDLIPNMRKAQDIRGAFSVEAIALRQGYT